MRRQVLLFFVTEDWYFCSHRLPLAIAAKKAGYDVKVVTRVRAHEAEIKRAGIGLIPVEMSRRGMNPFDEVRFIRSLVSIYKKEKPDIVHHVALKPVLYGTIAAFFAKVPSIVNALAGLGFLFTSRAVKVRLVRPWLKLVFRIVLNRRNGHVILQNPDDVRLLCEGAGLNPSRVSLIRGSGVDPQQFAAHPELPGKMLVLLASRLLWDKGVGEFVEAARLLKRQGALARFVLVGSGDDANPASISDEQLQAWHDEGVIEWWGRRDDMPEVIAQSHIVCLPSYREGMPKVLIEAASSAKPIVSTDTPGCREIVRDGVNGFLVPVRDATAVAEALQKMLDSPELRRRMGKNGREMVINEFSLKKVNAATLDLYRKLLNDEDESQQRVEEV